MERNVVHEKKGLFVASGRGFRRGFFEKRLFENANGLEEPIWKNLPRVFLCECLLIRVSRVRAPDGAVKIAVFADIVSRGDGDFFACSNQATQGDRHDGSRGLAHCCHHACLLMWRTPRPRWSAKRGIEVRCERNRTPRPRWSAKRGIGVCCMQLSTQRLR